MRHGVGCADNQHCCPHDAPVCDTDKGVCVSEDGKKTVPWTTKVPASYTDSPKPLPEDDDIEYGEYTYDYGAGEHAYDYGAETDLSAKDALKLKQPRLSLDDAAAAGQTEGMAVV
jgi:hypothetical protein